MIYATSTFTCRYLRVTVLLKKMRGIALEVWLTIGCIILFDEKSEILSANNQSTITSFVLTLFFLASSGLTVLSMDRRNPAIIVVVD